MTNNLTNINTSQTTQAYKPKPLPKPPIKASMEGREISNQPPPDLTKIEARINTAQLRLIALIKEKPVEASAGLLFAKQKAYEFVAQDLTEIAKDLTSLKEKYGDNEQIVKHLTQVQNYIVKIENISKIIQTNNAPTTPQASQVPNKLTNEPLASGSQIQIVKKQQPEKAGEIKKESPQSASSNQKLTTDQTSKADKKVATDQKLAANKKTLAKGLHQYTQDYIKDTQPIAEDYAKITSIENQRTSHINAKKFFKEGLAKVAPGSSVDFVKSPSKYKTPKLKDVKIPKTENPLNPKTFSFEHTSDVKQDIINAGNRNDETIVMFGAASQFNSAESTEPKTPLPGKAVSTYMFDGTQGPAAQLANKNDVTEMLLLAANKGLNCLCNVLDASTKTAVKHGWLNPKPSQTRNVIKQLREKGSEIEYTCIGSVPKGGSKVVHQMYVSTIDCNPDRYKLGNFPSDLKEIQFLCALHGFRAQYAQSIELAKKEGKKVICKPVAVGLGDFHNDPEVVAKAFYLAGKDFEQELSENNVEVRFQVYKPKNGEADKKASKMSKFLGLRRTLG